jgi:hypothetical protein
MGVVGGRAFNEVIIILEWSALAITRFFGKASRMTNLI